MKRLLNSIYQNVDAGNIKVFAQILNYEESQLMQDIEAIKSVDIVNKED